MLFQINMQMLIFTLKEFRVSLYTFEMSDGLYRIFMMELRVYMVCFFPCIVIISRVSFLSN